VRKYGCRPTAGISVRSSADPAIFVAGDAALPEAPRGAAPRLSVLYALATGAHVADALADERAGRRLRPFGYWTYGQAIGLGREAVGFATFPFDRALPPYYTGRAGFHLRHFFIWLLFAILRAQRRWPGLPFALGRPHRRSIAAEAPG
jgi:NADH dehydrogenase FAD-containing subunit